jgi:hypothetical protein
VAPYQQTRILILYRKSVHLAVLSSTDLAIEAVHEITRQIGCSARNTVATCGSAILWLSDSGVHALQIGQELNLVSAAAPLSEPVADIMERVNAAAAGRACAVFFDNRYWLALPLDGSGVNNAVLVFNFLNGGWESLDTFPAGFDIQNFCVLEHGGARRLHVVTTFGYVYLPEDREDGRDESGDIASGALEQAAFRLVSRGFAFGTVEPKRFSYLQLDAGAGAGDAVMVSVSVRNPDAVVQLPAFRGGGGGDVSSRRRLRARGVSAQVVVAAAAGRRSVSGFVVAGAAGNRRVRDIE